MNFHQDAVDFVRKHNCASTTPVELIEKAMEHGAKEALDYTNNRIGLALETIRKQRAANIGSHSETKTINLDTPENT